MPGDSFGLTRPGAYFPPKDGYFYNRSNADIVRGQIIMLDWLLVQTETTQNYPGTDGASVWSNGGPVTQASHDMGYPMLLAAEDIKDNARGRFWLRHPYIEIAIVDADVSTTDVTKGGLFTCLVTQASSAGGALTTGGAALQKYISGTSKRVLGISWEDAAADSTDTDRLMNASDHLRWGCWFGGYPGAGLTLA